MMRQYDLVERVLRYDPTADEDLINRAYIYAMKAHGNQKRKSGAPYFSHPLEVAAKGEILLPEVHAGGLSWRGTGTGRYDPV